VNLDIPKQSLMSYVFLISIFIRNYRWKTDLRTGKTEKFWEISQSRQYPERACHRNFHISQVLC